MQGLAKPAIVKAYVRHYRDNGQTTAYVEWDDGSRSEGTESSLHMAALFAAARRAGITPTKEIW